MREAVYDISRSEAIQGWMNIRELTWLAQQASRSSLIAELGCWRGRSTSALVQHTSGKVWVVDTWNGASDPNNHATKEVLVKGSLAIEEEFKNNFSKEISSGKLSILKMSSVSGAEWLLKNVGPLFDFVFIDADHQYEYVLNDITASLRLLKSGGLIAGHDFWRPGVSKAVREIFDNCQRPVGSIWSVSVL